jgi:hypothetical protein
VLNKQKQRWDVQDFEPDRLELEEKESYLILDRTRQGVQVLLRLVGLQLEQKLGVQVLLRLVGLQLEQKLVELNHGNEKVLHQESQEYHLDRSIYLNLGAAVANSTPFF